MLSKNKDTDVLILSFLKPEDLYRMEKVSESFKKLVDLAWQKKLYDEFSIRYKYLPKVYEKLSFYNKYMELNQSSKLISMSEEEFKNFEINELSDFSEQLQEKIDKGDLPLCRGDVVYFDWFMEVGEHGKFIWDGKQLLRPEQYFHKLVEIPKEFTYPEFPIDHFRKTFGKHKLWLSEVGIKEAIRTYNSFGQLFYIGETVIYPPLFMNKDEFEKWIFENPYVYWDKNDQIN